MIKQNITVLLTLLMTSCSSGDYTIISAEEQYQID